ncbi:MAG TPA: VacJ family lipoprotein [Burkholderiaceae bacterium]|jgi:phospholipid-binding lipoprotein MlaA
MTPAAVSSRRWLALAMVLLLALGGCATIKDARGGPGARLDPWENWNRKVFAFNESLDENVLKPIATGYAKVVPQMVRQGIDNFFNNAADAWSAVNNILQGKPEPALQDVVRVTTNTFFGILGIFDVASEMGLEHHYEDLGQTFGRWGFGPGAYIVWPLLGPSTVRDSIALPADRWFASPALYIQDGRWKVGITAVQLINTRANLLGATKLLDDIAIDKYSFVRDAYLQRRRSLVFDGDAPPDPADQSEGPPGPDSAASAASPAAPPAVAASAAPAAAPEPQPAAPAAPDSPASAASAP